MRKDKVELTFISSLQPDDGPNCKRIPDRGKREEAKGLIISYELSSAREKIILEHIRNIPDLPGDDAQLQATMTTINHARVQYSSLLSMTSDSDK